MSLYEGVSHYHACFSHHHIIEIFLLTNSVLRVSLCKCPSTMKCPSMIHISNISTLSKCSRLYLVSLEFPFVKIWNGRDVNSFYRALIFVFPLNTLLQLLPVHKDDIFIIKSKKKLFTALETNTNSGLKYFSCHDGHKNKFSGS